MRMHICRHCSKVFDDYSNLQRHLETHDSPSSKHVCERCDRSFGKQYNLQRHWRTTCDKGKRKSHDDRYVCEMRSKIWEKTQSAATRDHVHHRKIHLRDILALFIVDFFGADIGVSIHLYRSDRNWKVQRPSPHLSKIPSNHPNDSPSLCRWTCWKSFASTGQPYDQA